MIGGVQPGTNHPRFETGALNPKSERECETDPGCPSRASARDTHRLDSGNVADLNLLPGSQGSQRQLCTEPVDKANLLPPVGVLLSEAKTATFFHSKARIANDECHRVVKAGTRISEVTDAAALLLSVSLYGPPHITKAHLTKGRVTRILVKPNFGGST